LILACPDDGPSNMTVWRWYNRFKDSIEGLKDQDRPGGPITATIPQNIETVRNLIDEDPHMSLHQLEAQTSLSYGTIERIIHDHLYLRKL